jgi:glutamine cyclotransferase
MAPALPGGVTQLDWEVLAARPHDPAAWTQGLQLDVDGRLYESTGLRGRSSLREVDVASGEVRREAPLPDDHFGEGLALVDDRLIQLTWQEGVAHVWDARTLEPIGAFGYAGEGWGLCYDGERLVMSDGSQRLTFRDADTFAITGSVEVDGAGLPAMRFNELECVDGLVWANAWLTDTIVRIDPVAGRVTGVLDLAGLLEQWPAAIDHGGAEPPDVLNGIAWDAVADTFLVTGKLWPALFEIRVEDAGAESTPSG